MILGKSTKKILPNRVRVVTKSDATSTLGFCNQNNKPTCCEFTYRPSEVVAVVGHVFRSFIKITRFGFGKT
uniref:Uncharacterized protein n=1 Tax=Panagrolaimus sp. PS1159 TaxID=55785 RepID=A0AC35G5A5_9BILA